METMVLCCVDFYIRSGWMCYYSTNRRGFPAHFIPCARSQCPGGTEASWLSYAGNPLREIRRREEKEKEWYRASANHKNRF
jgi:hypothetical protein